jgi:ferritin
LKLFENVFEHEREVSSSINELYGAAIEERDFATQSFLTWFVNEQVEEENNAHAIVETLKMAGDESSVLLIVDQQLGARAKPTGSETEAE